MARKKQTTTINDLYLNYVNSVGPALEEDRYFQYLFEMFRAGENSLEQKSQLLHKEIEDDWMDIIEDTIQSLYKIIDKPRRFITTKEEVVPVSLAKKITADSVRHLSQNTQFIASTDNGDVQPTKILNVTVEESYDLYENRFIYHLIQRLVTFIDKRTDVLFWVSGDETRNVLTLKSKVDDAYEQIEYNLEMKITNHQNAAEKDSENMDAFMRIDRIRRLVTGLRHSSFCDLMKGCSKVKSPIQRTNLIMKDPDYRKCYQLWKFMERYDKVGYKIVEENSTLQFDEEYLFQLYTNVIGNYALLKSLGEPDNRDSETILNTKRRERKPRFKKSIKEEYLDSAEDIEDVEIRRIFVEEVTQAQLDAEAALEAEKQKVIDLERQLDVARNDIEEANTRANTAYSRLEVAEADTAAAVRAMEEALAGKKQAEEDAAQTVRDADLRIASADAARQQADQARMAAEDAKDQADIARIAAQAKAERDATEAVVRFNALQKEKEEAEDKLKQAVAAKQQAEAATVAAKNAAADEKEKLLADISNAEQKLSDAEKAAEDLRVKSEADLSAAKKALEDANAAAKSAMDSAVRAADEERAKLQAEIKLANDKRLLAEEKAERGSIFKYMFNSGK